MEPGKREPMRDRSRVIDLVVDEIEGQSKLNQHKSDADHVAVDRLRADETASQRLAEKMRALRPELEYDVGRSLGRVVNGSVRRTAR